MLTSPPPAVAMPERVPCSNTPGYDNAVRPLAATATGLRSSRPYAEATSTGVALALAGLAVLGSGFVEPVAAAATALPAGANGPVQEVKVPAADLESVGIPGGVSAPILLARQPVLTAEGKVEVAYVGGGWCPYCALGNWPLQVALSQFGTFTQLGGPLSSSPTDVYPGLKSWSFTGSRYTSKYFKLDAFETAPEKVSAPGSLNTLLEKYDQIAYTQSPGSIPFTDLGDHFLVLGAPSSVAPLLHLSQAQVAADLRNPDSAVARTVDGAANYLVAAMCLTPGASSPPICASKFAQRIDAMWAPSFPTTTTTTVRLATTTSTTTATVPTTTSLSTTTTTSATSSSTTTTAYS
jgi:Domain of unknown function (DUF929)